MHQHVHIEPLEQSVVRRGICERYEHHFERLVACCVCGCTCAGVRDEGCQDWQDLLQAVVAPECCFILLVGWSLLVEYYGWYVLPSSTVMLLERA